MKLGSTWIRGDVMEPKKKINHYSIFGEALNYIRKTLSAGINTLLIIIGAALVLFSFIRGGELDDLILGIFFILFFILRILYTKLLSNTISLNTRAYSFTLLCQFTALALEMLPDAVKIPFAAGPNKWVANSFSYFSLTPVGYADFFPFLTGAFTVTAAVLCVVSLIRRGRMQKILNAAFICSVIDAALSIPILFKYGSAYTSALNYIISALIVISTFLQAVTNRHLAK